MRRDEDDDDVSIEEDNEEDNGLRQGVVEEEEEEEEGIARGKEQWAVTFTFLLSCPIAVLFMSSSKER